MDCAKQIPPIPAPSANKTIFMVVLSSQRLTRAFTERALMAR